MADSFEPDMAREAILASPAYRIAYEDLAFLAREELRPVRLQLELQKTQLELTEHDITSTIVVFGSTRVVERSAAEAALRDAQQVAAAQPGDASVAARVRIAERRVLNSHFYDEARRFARIVSGISQRDGRCDYVIMTGGGPGIMEAANRGAHDIGAKSIGLNITLPFEQAPNPYITPDLCFQFHYFAIRKMHFLIRAKALVAFPGGFGTIDELFETLTLVQTRKVKPMPVILFGRDFWNRVINFEALVEEGTVAAEDLALFRFAETAEEAWNMITAFYGQPA